MDEWREIRHYHPLKTTNNNINPTGGNIPSVQKPFVAAPMLFATQSQL